MSRHALLLGLVAVTLGCEEALPPPKTSVIWEGTPAQTGRGPLPRAVAALRLAVAPSGNPNVDKALAAALAAAGFTVVEIDDEHKDAKVSTNTGTTNDGPADAQQRVNVTVNATVVGPSGPIARASATFTTRGDDVSESALSTIATSLAQSRTLLAFARERTPTDEGPGRGKARPEARPKPKGDRRADEHAWITARPITCKQPTRADACDGVQAYLADYPDGAHADQAKALLDEAQPALERAQKDASAWENAGVDVCRREHKRTPCAGVEVYRVKFPGGAHIDEANTLLEGL